MKRLFIALALLAAMTLRAEDAAAILAKVDQFRSPHLWKKDGDRWTLRHQVS